MSLRLALARSGVRLGMLLGIAAVVAGIAGAGTWTLQTVWAAGPAGMRAGIAALTGADGAMRWSTELASDPTEQTAQAAGAAEVLDRIDPADATWWRSLVSRPTPIRSGTAGTAGTAGGTDVVLRADAELPARAELISGTWPAAADETALNETAAAAGWDEGDEVVVAGQTLRITGLWRATDPGASAWMGDATGTSTGAAGTLLVTEQTLRDVDLSISAEWTVLPSADLAPEHSARLVTALDGIGPALRDDEVVAPYGISIDGDLIPALTGITAGVGAVRAIAPLPLLLIAVTGVAALNRLVSLLAAARETEHTLLRGRGASAAGLARGTAAEALALGIPAAAVGAVIGALHAPPAPGAVAVLTAASALLTTIVIAAGRAFGDARAPLTRDGARHPVRRITGIAAAVLLVAGAVLSLWQLQLYGSPLVTTADGTASIDPLAALAPALALVAMPLIALVAVPRLATRGARASARRRGLVPVLPRRQRSRRTPLFAAAAFVTMVAVGGLTLTAAVAGTWRSLDAHAAQVASGGDVVVELPGGDAAGEAAGEARAASDDYSALPGVDTALPVVAEPARVGSDPVDVIAVPASEAAPVLPDAREALQRIAADLSPSDAVSGDLVAAEPVPVALDAELSDGIGAVEGDPVRFRLASGATIEGVVAAITPLVPRSSGTGAILADLGALERAAHESGERLPEVGQVWLMTGEGHDPDAVARAAATVALSTPGAIVSTASDHSTARLVAPLLGALGIGAAAALLLAIVTLCGLGAYLARERESEVGVLRALGAPGRLQARARFAELAAVFGGAGAAGIGIGMLAAWATARELARAAVPDAPAALTATLELDLLPWAVGIVAFALLATAVATAAASRVRRQAEGGRS